MTCDCFDQGLLFPGQIELYTHLPVMRQLVEQLQQWEFRVCGVFLVDSQFMVESFKVTISTMLSSHSSFGLQCAHFSLVSNCSLFQESWLL